MVSKIFEEKLNLAHNLIDEEHYGEAVDILKNLIARVHDKETLQEITTHMKQVDEMYNKRYKEETDRNGEPWRKYNEALTFLNDLNKWKAQELLKFFDKMSKEHDV